MSTKENDIFYEALQETQEEKIDKIKDWQFLNWICSKEEILTGENAIKPYGEGNQKTE